MALKSTDPVHPIISKMQSALEGQANTDILAATCYIIANAVAILARDQAEGEQLINELARDQRKILKDVWPGVRAELERQKLL